MSLLKHTYYIGAGFENKMYTLRQNILFERSDGYVSESDTYVKNLSTDYDEAYAKAVKYAKESNVKLEASLIGDLDPIERKTKKEHEKYAVEFQVKIDDFLKNNPVLAQYFETYGNVDYEDKEVRDGIGYAFFDIKDKLYTYGKLSNKQVDFAIRLVEDYVTRKENTKKWAEEKANAEPVPVTDERIQFTGEVIKTTFKDYVLPNGMQTSSQKCTVKDDRGFVVWGGDVGEKGDRITFMATVTVSDKDPKFGFFKRPTKIQQI